MNVLIVDDMEKYRVVLRQRLSEIDDKVEVDETDDASAALSFDFNRFDLIVLDNRNTGSSYWDELLPPLRRRYPRSEILLVSEVPLKDLEEDVKAFGSETTELLASDALVSFIQKGANAQAHAEHYQAVFDFTKDLLLKINRREDLIRELTAAILASVRALRHQPLSLLGRDTSTQHGSTGSNLRSKEDTLSMDVVAEGAESESEAIELYQMGCAYAQGYVFGEAMTAVQARRMIGATTETA